MAAISKHYGDVANWIEAVIDSCENPLQESAARKLIRLFEKKYLDKLDTPTFWEVSRRLNHRLDDKLFGRLDKKLNRLHKL
jgi:hypothetical protein